MYLRTMAISAALMSAGFSFGQETTIEKPKALECVVTEADDDPQFFGITDRIGKAPIVGDKIKMNIDVTHLMSMVFESGNEIPLDKFNVIMPKVNPENQSLFTQFSAAHQGVLGYYEGNMIIAHVNDKSTATISVVKSRGESVAFNMKMECKNL